MRKSGVLRGALFLLAWVGSASVLVAIWGHDSMPTSILPYLVYVVIGGVAYCLVEFLLYAVFYYVNGSSESRGRGMDERCAPNKPVQTDRASRGG